MHLVKASLVCSQSQVSDINLLRLKCKCQVLISRFVLEHVASHLLYNNSSPCLLMMFVLGISIYVTWHKEMCLPVSQDDVMAKGL